MGRLVWVEPKESEVTAPQTTWLQNHLNELNTALIQPDYTNPKTGKNLQTISTWIPGSAIIGSTQSQ